VSQDKDSRIEEAISGLGEPERSILAALLVRVEELEGEVAGLREGRGGAGSLADRVERLEEAVEGAGSGGLEETVDRVDRLEEEVREVRDDMRDLQGEVDSVRG